MNIYANIQSGNCYKIKLLCSFLEIDHGSIHINILENGIHAQDLLNKNLNRMIFQF